MIIRTINKNEHYLLTDFIYESIFQQDADNLIPRTIIQNPSILVYIEEFGSKKDDHCLVAEVDNLVVGAVWVRCIKGFGHVDDETPEFAISIYPEYRGKGIGTKLMKEMLKHLKTAGYSKTSLSVQKKNQAYNLYSKLGFKPVIEHEEEFIMVYTLN